MYAFVCVIGRESEGEGESESEREIKRGREEESFFFAKLLYGGNGERLAGQ